MIFIIFTAEGLTELASQGIDEGAVLWLNPSLLNSPTATELHDNGITLHALPDEIALIKEKTVSTALTHVEQHSPKGKEIFVEYL